MLVIDLNNWFEKKNPRMGRTIKKASKRLDWFQARNNNKPSVTLNGLVEPFSAGVFHTLWFPFAQYEPGYTQKREHKVNIRQPKKIWSCLKL